MPATLHTIHDPHEISDDELDQATARYFIRQLHYEAEALQSAANRLMLRDHHAARRLYAQADVLKDVARGWAAGLR